MDVLMSPEDRLTDWKKFRNRITEMDDTDQILAEVAQYWSTVPMVNYYLDFDHPKEWPTSWELLHEGEFCKSGVSYLMRETLILSDEKWKDRTALWLINDRHNVETYIVLVVDEKFVLNYELRQIESTQYLLQNSELICIY